MGRDSFMFSAFEGEGASGRNCVPEAGDSAEKVTGGEYNQKLWVSCGNCWISTKNRGLLLKVRSLVRCWYSPG